LILKLHKKYGKIKIHLSTAKHMKKLENKLRESLVDKVKETYKWPPKLAARYPSIWKNAFKEQQYSSKNGYIAWLIRNVSQTLYTSHFLQGN
jgi:hypothetical protein